MTYRWRYLDASGGPVDGPDEDFDDQAEAEAWFGDEWEELRTAGVDAVELIGDDGTRVYGPMSLDEA